MADKFIKIAIAVMLLINISLSIYLLYQVERPTETPRPTFQYPEDDSGYIPRNPAP